MLALTQIRQWVPAHKKQNPTGFTLLEVVFSLAIIAGLLTLFAKVGSPAVTRAELHQSMSNMRKFQGAVILFHAQYERVPTTDELYHTYLQGEQDLGFIVVSARDVRRLPTHRQAGQEPFRRPTRWLIVSREGFLPLAEFIYAIDDGQPVETPPGREPFNHRWLIDRIAQVTRR